MEPMRVPTQRWDTRTGSPCARNFSEASRGSLTLPDLAKGLGCMERIQREGAAGIEIGAACIVCWRPGTDRAHLIDRSLAPDPKGDPLRTVRLCRQHHDEYDAHALDLLPYLEPRHRAELAKAVEVHGLVSTLERVTGQHWTSTAKGAVRFEVTPRA